MTPDADPGAAPDYRSEQGRALHKADGPSREVFDEVHPEEQARDARQDSMSSEAIPVEIVPGYHYPLEPMPDASRWASAVSRLIPNLGHTFLFFLLAFIVLAVGQGIGLVLLQQTHLFGHHSFQAFFRLSADDARLSLPVQAFSYALVAAVVIPVFSLLWHEPFGEGVHWNARTARRRVAVLAIIGLAAGFGIGAFGNFLPMPKDPPIMQDMMKSPTGAWMMLIFGISAAPLLEELAFRGFLLPGLINSFRWLARKSVIPDGAVRWIGIPISVLITSIGFAFLHSPQVSHAWGPLVLIGTVSIILCVVRLSMNSVAAGVVVHAAYNLTLFAGVLAQTGGFRHLDKLTT